MLPSIRPVAVTLFFVSHLEICGKLSTPKKPVTSAFHCYLKLNGDLKKKHRGLDLTLLIAIRSEIIPCVVQVRVCYMRHFGGKIKIFGVESFAPYAYSRRICLLEFFLLFLSLKQIKNSNGQIRRLYAYAVNGK